jgi:formamidopyrimidine-DNA glycosylase
MEAWRRQLNDPVSELPIARAGPAHIATLKTFDPPLDALEGRRFRGAERRGKRLLFPTDDGELVLLVHLMSAGRLRFVEAGGATPKSPAFRLEFAGGAQLILTEGGKKKRAGVWLLTPEAAEAELAHLGPEALGLGPERLGEVVHGESRRLRREDVPRPPPARRAVPRLRHPARAGRLRGAHDLLLPDLPDGRARAQGPPPVAPAQVSV